MGPLETSFGLHLIEVIERRPAEVEPSALRVPYGLPGSETARTTSPISNFLRAPSRVSLSVPSALVNGRTSNGRSGERWWIRPNTT